MKSKVKLCMAILAGLFFRETCASGKEDPVIAQAIKKAVEKIKSKSPESVAQNAIAVGLARNLITKYDLELVLQKLASGDQEVIDEVKKDVHLIPETDNYSYARVVAAVVRVTQAQGKTPTENLLANVDKIGDMFSNKINKIQHKLDKSPEDKTLLTQLAAAKDEFKDFAAATGWVKFEDQVVGHSQD